MDRRERYNDPEEMLRIALAGFQASVWTALPCIVESFDAAACTVKAQPTIKAVLEDEQGVTSTVTLPLLLDCPVVFQRGGGFTLTFPVKPGDECLVIFASRCIDAWWQSGGVQEQAELRMHDLSDGFAIVGPFSKPSVISAINTDAPQLRSNDGTSYVEVAEDTITIQTTSDVIINAPNVTVNCEVAEVNADTSATVNTDTAAVNATTSLTVTSPLSTFIGNVIIQGTATVQGLLSYLAGLAGIGGGAGSHITGDIVQTGGVLSSEGTVLHTHTHGGVQTGSGSTGAPN